jgi:BirA family biotin operon repressor/biotin-[acetyl-CoA-carboxylase] ligase
MSLILKVTNINHHILKYAMISSLATACSIQQITNSLVTIKWVNDIYISDKKVSGILIETVKTQDSYIIIGIGINFLHDNPLIPYCIRDKAASIFNKQATTTRNQLIAEIINNMNLYSTQNIQYIKNKYKQLCLLLNKHISYTQNERIYEGIVTDIGDNGELIVLVDGCRRSIFSGDVSINGDFFKNTIREQK